MMEHSGIVKEKERHRTISRMHCLSEKSRNKKEVVELHWSSSSYRLGFKNGKVSCKSKTINRGLVLHPPDTFPSNRKVSQSLTAFKSVKTPLLDVDLQRE